MPAFSADFQAELAELIALRRDVRRFRRDAVSEETVTALLALTDLSPSVGLAQPWRFVRVADAARRAAVREAFVTTNHAALDGYDGETRQLYASLKLEGLDDAPVHFAVFVEPEPEQGHGLGRRTMPETVAYSAVCAIHTLWLAARAFGIGVGWVSILPPERMAELLDVPPDWQFIAWLCLGYPVEDSTEPELQRAGWERRRRGEVIER